MVPRGDEAFEQQMIPQDGKGENERGSQRCSERSNDWDRSLTLAGIAGRGRKKNVRVLVHAALHANHRTTHPMFGFQHIHPPRP